MVKLRQENGCGRGTKKNYLGTDVKRITSMSYIALNHAWSDRSKELEELYCFLMSGTEKKKETDTGRHKDLTHFK
jgi:hypothetical protein